MLYSKVEPSFKDIIYKDMRMLKESVISSRACRNLGEYAKDWVEIEE